MSDLIETCTWCRWSE